MERGEGAAYEGAVRWLERYADTHAEVNPIDGKRYLPAGEKTSYYERYKKDMLERHGVTEAGVSDASAYALASKRPKRQRIVGKRPVNGSLADAETYVSASTVVDLDSFLRAWLIECPWLIVHGSDSQAICNPRPPVLKRPAARSTQLEPVQYVAEAESAIPPPPPAWSQPILASQPKWAHHAVHVLQEHSHLPKKLGQEKYLELTLWVDCGGINSEMFALATLGEALRELLNVSVKWILYMTCESDTTSRKFAELNHDPMHISDQMQHRNFQTGQVTCSKHGANHDMPKHGVDLYVGTYPCSPWSRRGKRTGFDHPDAEVSIIGMQTIAFISPAVFVLELGEMPSQDALQEILQKVQQLVQAGVAKYTIHVVRNLTPAWSGYPTRRKRLFIIGWRSDIDGTRAGEPLQSLMDSPMVVENTFLRFLGLQREVDWSRVGECPTQQELLILSASPCRCGLDPMVLCPVHPCKCGRCGESGVECTWRRMFMSFLSSNALANVISKKMGTVTYLQVLEMHGREGPPHARQRVLINLIATRPESQPLNDTLMVGDVSQNPPFGDMYNEGDTPVFTTSSNVWVFQVGHTLQLQHMAALMGLDLSVVKFLEGMSETWFRQRLGLAVHISNFGLVLMAALAPPLRVCCG